MKSINIYLTPEERKLVDQKMQWYKVSLSTLVDKCVIFFAREINDVDIKKMLLMDYYYKPKGKIKTSCKPRYFKGMEKCFKHPNRFATNCLLIWIKKDIKQLSVNGKTLEPKKADKIYSLIDNELNKTVDKFWNYNEQIRNMRRMLKDDKDYWKRAIEQEENKK